MNEPPPPPLSDAYRKSRMYYGIFSGLMLACVFDGTQMDAKNLLAHVGLNFVTTDRLPIILSVLVLYFAYLTCVEWYQCDDRRRALMPSRIDFIVSHVVGIASTFTYWIQPFLPPQLGQIIIDRAPTALILVAVVLFALFGRIVGRFVSKGFYQDRWYGRTPMTRLLTFGLCFSVVQGFYLYYAVEAVMGSQILQKGNTTFAVLYLSSFLLYALGYGVFIDTPKAGEKAPPPPAPIAIKVRDTVSLGGTSRSLGRLLGATLSFKMDGHATGSASCSATLE